MDGFAERPARVDEDSLAGFVRAVGPDICCAFPVFLAIQGCRPRPPPVPLPTEPRPWQITWTSPAAGGLCSAPDLMGIPPPPCPALDSRQTEAPTIGSRAEATKRARKGHETPIEVTLTERVRSLGPTLEDEWRKWAKDSLPEGSWSDLKARNAPRSWSGPALATFLGLVYGSSVADSGMPRGIAWNGRRAALADLISHFKSRGNARWPTFLAEHKGRDFRYRGDGPKRHSRDTLEEFFMPR